MVVPWIGYIIWKNWVIHVLVFLVFHVFSTAELISIAKTVNLAVWAFSSNFLHDFTLFAIDMNYIYHILSIATTFGALSNMTFLGQKCIPILGMRRKENMLLKMILVSIIWEKKSSNRASVYFSLDPFANEIFCIFHFLKWSSSAGAHYTGWSTCQPIAISSLFIIFILAYFSLKSSEIKLFLRFPFPD